MAYIKGRYIGTNVRITHDIFNLYNEQNISGLLMFADFRKAFDSIEWDFLFRVLQKFNFGSDFQQWIKLLYTRPWALVKNNVFFSEEFSLWRGVRQGCSVSSLSFILCMEVVSGHIRQNQNIKGLCIDRENTRLSKLYNMLTMLLSF